MGRYHKDYTGGPVVREKPKINKLSRSLSYKSDYANTEVVDRLLAGREKFLKAQRLGIPIVDENKPPLRRKRKRSSVGPGSSRAASEREQFEPEDANNNAEEQEDGTVEHNQDVEQAEEEQGEEQIQDFDGDDDQV